GVALCSLALATALRTTFSIITLARFLEKRSIARASSTSRPRIKSITSRALRGAMRANRCLASNGIQTSGFRVRGSGFRVQDSISEPRTLNPEPSFSSSRGRRRGRGTGGSFGGLLAGVATEHSRRRKLAELVADHVFLHEHLQELVPVVNLKRMAHKLRDDR